MSKRLPDFVIIGAQKSGTTSLWHYLRSQPKVFMPQEKEPCFFSHDDRFARGLEWYSSLFEPAQESQLIGEASASYYLTETWPLTISRMQTTGLQAKFIFLVRHPLERLPSAWLQYRCAGHPLSGNFSRDLFEYGRLLEGSEYAKTVRAWQEAFGPQNLHIEFFEDLNRKPRETVKRCLDFLGVPIEAETDFGTRLNSAGTKRIDRQSFKRFANATSWMRGRLWRTLSRTSIWRKLRAKVQQSAKKPEWTDELWSKAAEHLRADTEAFLQLTGKPNNYWDLEFERRHV